MRPRSLLHDLGLVVALGSLLSVSCGLEPIGAGGGGVIREPLRTVVVYAAASLDDVFRDLATAYERERAGTEVVLSFDASNLLRARIEEGAPADALAAADTDNPMRLVAAGLAEGEPVAFARTELAIVVPASNPARIDRAIDLARPGVRIVAAGDDVPISRYARSLLENIARTRGAPEGFSARVMRNVVSREDNVRAVLAKVELGEADAGIVYRTDAASTGRVRAIRIPAGGNIPVTYAAVAISRQRTTTPGAGSDFVHWLRSDGASAILVRAGFGPP